MTKTVSTYVENQEIIIALFAACKFNEIARTVTGGMQSAERLILTFEGKEEDYSEEYFVEIPSPGSSTGYKSYYSLRIPEGCYVNKYEVFLKNHNKQRQVIEVKPIT